MFRWLTAWSEVVALEVPALLRRRRRRLDLLQLRTFVRVGRVEVRVRSRRDAAVEATNLSIAGGSERGAGAAPAWTCAAVVDCGLLGRTCGDEVVVEVDVVELDNLRQRRNRRRDDPADLVALELGEPHFSVGSADDSRRLRRGRRIAYSSIAPDIVMRPTRRSAAATGSRIERHLTQPSSTRDLRADFRRCVCCTYFVYCIWRL